MALSFFETMSGELVDGDGQSRHVAIDIQCDAPSVASFALRGVARIRGTISAAPWAQSAACEGTLEVSPLRDRRIGYDVAFTGDDGTPCRLVGEKRLDARQLVASMTNLDTVLEHAGQRTARGTLRFDMNTLPHFLGSWRVGAAPGQLAPTAPPADPELPTAAVLSAAELRILAAFAEAIIAPGGLVPPSDEQTLGAAEAVLAGMPALVQQLYRSGLQSLDVMAMLRHGTNFAALDVADRRALIDAAESVASAGAGVVMALGMPVKIAHFSRREVAEALGLPDYTNPVREPQPRWLQNHVDAESLDRHHVVDCDVVVVGTGAGGGPVAATLAEAGFGVVLVEEGHYHRREAFHGSPEQRLLRFWRDGGVHVTLGNTPVVVPLGRMVGGSTAINSGTCYRTPDAVLAEWRDAGLPDDFAPERFAQWLDRAESELGVAEAEPRHLGSIAEVVRRGAEALGGDPGPLRRNAPGCEGHGLCVVGCPTGAKRSSDVSWVPRALRAGATLYTGLPVRTILRRGRRAVGVVAAGQDRHGVQRTIEVRARAVVLACGTFHTPTLLADNGVTSPWLGRNLSVHPAVGAFARFAASLGEPWNAIPQSYRVDGLVDPRVRFEGFYAPPQLAAPTMPLARETLTSWVNDWPKVGQYGFMVRDRGNGRVVRGPDGRPLAHYTLAADVVGIMRRGAAVLAEMLLVGGASEVALPIAGVDVIRDIPSARALATRPLAPHHFRLMGFHPLGTCRIGGRREDSVLDPDHRVWDTEGLYVADGSAIPTSLGVNPQITIMAAALRCADGIAARL